MLQANMTTLRQEEKDLLLDSDCVPGRVTKGHAFFFCIFSYFQLLLTTIKSNLIQILLLVLKTSP